MNKNYEVVVLPHAGRDLDKLPANIFLKVDAEIWKLRLEPRPFGVKKLNDDLHRIRIGNHRVIYAIFDREKRVVILRIAKRNERTYKNF